jgi:hypothetical protein
VIELKQEDAGRISIHRDGIQVGNARALADKHEPLVCLRESVVLRLSEFEEIAEKLRDVANDS